ncbi:MAG: flavodoxin family protein [Candidatus Omnitrophica bacterium]|nr:flavodoxin family protein [Candidatus Omnitrophota bacterium]
MKILGINCSPRKGKTTFFALEQCLTAAQEADSNIKTEIIELSGLRIFGCSACGKCAQGLQCGLEDDFIKIIPKLNDREVKGIIIGTPVYLGTMTSQSKAFLDRTVMFRRNGFIFRDKIGGVLAVGGVRNGGQELTIQAVQSAMFCHDMIVVSDGMNTSHFGGALCSGADKGIENDEIGLTTARNLGRRIAKTIKMLNN